MATAEFSKFAGMLSAALSSIIFQDFEELNRNAITSTRFVHNDVITQLEPDILECEVKWALESITTNKASGGDGIPVELFQILKDDA